MLQQVFDVIFLSKPTNERQMYARLSMDICISQLHPLPSKCLYCLLSQFLSSSIRRREKLFSSLKLKCRIFNEQVTLLSLDFLKFYLFYTMYYNAFNLRKCYNSCEQRCMGKSLRNMKTGVKIQGV